MANETQHPVRDEIVEEIKLKATSWKPKEVHENHLRHVPADKIKGRFGQLGTTPFSKGVETMTKITKGAMGMFDQMTSALGLKGSALEHHLQQASDALEVEASADDWGLSSGIPASFSWREKMPECLGPIENQGECGACWAFASAGLLADRFCIHSNGAVKTRFSA